MLPSDIQAPGGETVLEPPSRQLSKMSIQPGQHHLFPGPLPWLLKRPSCWHSCLPPGHAPLRGRSDHLKTHIGSHHCSMDPSGSPYCCPSKIQTSQCGLQDPEVLCPTHLSSPLLSHCPQPHWPSFSSASVPTLLSGWTGTGHCLWFRILLAPISTKLLLSFSLKVNACRPAPPSPGGLF